MRTTGTAPNFRVPSPDSPSREMWITVALCVFLPPIGLIRLWAKARCPLRGKLIVSIIGLLSMTLILTIIISANRTNPYLVQTTPDYQLMLQQQSPAAPTPVPQETVAPAQPADPGANEEIGGDSSLVPANPALSR